MIKPYFNTTSPDLSVQILSRNYDELLRIFDPDVSIETTALDFMRVEEENRKQEECLQNFSSDEKPKPERKPGLVIGCGHIHVWAPPSTGVYPLATAWDIFLAKIVEREQKARIENNVPHCRIFADLGSGAGYFANRILKGNYVQTVFFFGETRLNAGAATRSFGLNYTLDTFNKYDISKGRVFRGHGQQVYFLNMNAGHEGYIVDSAVAAPQFFPGIHSDENPYYKLISDTLKMDAKELWIAHLSAARGALWTVADRHKAFDSRVVAQSRPIRFVRDTLEGAVDIPLTREQKANPTKFGLEKERNEFYHKIEVSYFDFR